MFTVTVNNVAKKGTIYEFENNPVHLSEIIKKINVDSTFDCPSPESIKLISKGKILKFDDVIDVLENPIIIIMVSKKLLPKPQTLPANLEVQSNVAPPPTISTPVNSSGVVTNPFISNSSLPNEVVIDENVIVMLTISQYIIIKQNPELEDLLDNSDNLVQKFIDSGLTNIEQIADPQIAQLFLTNYLKHNENGIKLVDELKPLCKKLIDQMTKDGEIGIVISKDKMNDIQSSDEFLDKMSPERLYSLKMNIINDNPHLTDMIFSFSDEEFKKFMKDQRKIIKIKEQLNKMCNESPNEFKTALHIFVKEMNENDFGKNNVNSELSEEDNLKIQEISSCFGFDLEDVKKVYIACNKNMELTVNSMYDSMLST